MLIPGCGVSVISGSRAEDVENWVCHSGEEAKEDGELEHHLEIDVDSKTELENGVLLDNLLVAAAALLGGLALLPAFVLGFFVLSHFLELLQVPLHVLGYHGFCVRWVYVFLCFSPLSLGFNLLSWLGPVDFVLETAEVAKQPGEDPLHGRVVDGVDVLVHKVNHVVNLVGIQSFIVLAFSNGSGGSSNALGSQSLVSCIRD